MVELRASLRALDPDGVSGGAASAAIGQARSVVSSFGRRGTYKRAHIMGQRVLALRLALDTAVTSHYVDVYHVCGRCKQAT